MITFVFISILLNGITLGNQVGYHGKTTTNDVRVIAKINKNDNLELGDKRSITTVIGKELKHYNGANSYTVLTTAHYNSAIYNKVTMDEKLKAITDRLTALENK